MESDDKPEAKRRHGHHGFIPAGILIGLGVGLLVNYPGPGVLIGLGCGFIASALIHHEEPGPSAAAPGFCGLAGRNWISLLIGFFMILIGIGLVWQPVLIWPYLIAILLILLGIGFALRGIRKL
jgi:hypothetical protein